MDAAFSSIAFADPARAEINLSFVEKRLPPSLWSALPALLPQLPDPDGALNFLERFLRPPESDHADVSSARDSVMPHITFLKRHPAALHHLLAIFSFSRFLSETLVQQPDLLAWLHRPARRGQVVAQALDRMRTPEDLHEEFARFDASGAGESRFTGTSFQHLPPALLLARFKRREYLRITLRDVLGLATLAETSLELSHLADVLLERALRLSEQSLQHSFGTPQYTDAAGNRHIARLSILSLGKLGGQELNYSSDIDLIFLYSHEGETSGGTSGTTTNAEYFVRLAQSVLKLVTEATPEGALYRVDMRLRPQGAEGELAASIPAALQYYRSRAREWELQMLIKGRCSAGDVPAARRFLREVLPLVYRNEFNLAAVEVVLNAREEITRDLQRRAARSTDHSVEWNVKLSLGGIRDIEFLTQCLQRLYGGTDSWLRAGSTLLSLQRLHDKGHLSGRDFFRLGTAYQFLRKVEHRLQLRDGLQRHTLPEAADALERLARRSGVEPVLSEKRTAGQQLVHRLTNHFAEVREIYDRILATRSPSTSTDHAESDPAAGALMHRLRVEYPSVAEAVTQALDALAPGEESYARRGLALYLSSAILDSALMPLLGEHPEWLARAAQLFAVSDFAVELLSRNPDEISILAEAEKANSISIGPLSVPDEDLTAVRVLYRRQVLRETSRALLGHSQLFDTFSALTRVTDLALSQSLHFVARSESLSISPIDDLSAAPFAVIALGRLGTSEMDIGSDVDLLFLADSRLSIEDREPWRRLAERFVHIASSHTRDGLLFPIDTRLRPRGSEGEILSTTTALLDYYRNDAEAWEAATFLKARPVAGNLKLGAEAIRALHAVLVERFSAPGPLADQLTHTRNLLERASVEKQGPEWGRLPVTKGEFKRVAGGFYDVEYILAFLFLTHGLQAGVNPSGHVLRQIAALELAGALSTAVAQSLRSASLLFRGIDHAVRLVTGRPANLLPEPALAQRIAPLLARWGTPVGDRIEPAVEAARRQTRARYEQLLLSPHKTQH